MPGHSVFPLQPFSLDLGLSSKHELVDTMLLRTNASDRVFDTHTHMDSVIEA